MKSQNVYKVTFDIRIGRTWLGGNVPWSSRNVIANGDARDAANKLERDEKRITYDGKRVNKVRILEIVRIASDVLP